MSNDKPAILTAYERYCAEACEWCAKGFGLSADPASHWTGRSNPPRCTALPLAQWAEQQAAELAELKAKVEAMEAEEVRLHELLALIPHTANCRSRKRLPFGEKARAEFDGSCDCWKSKVSQ